jgi:hypothetical protein
MRTDGRLSRSPLKGTLRDAVFAVLKAYGHNIRKSWPTSGLGLHGLSPSYGPPKPRQTAAALLQMQRESFV